MKYRTINAYLSYAFDKPILIPAGTVGTYFEQAKAYLFHVGNYAVPVAKWAVEAWHNYFEAVQE